MRVDLQPRRVQDRSLIRDMLICYAPFGRGAGLGILKLFLRFLGSGFCCGRSGCKPGEGPFRALLFICKGYINALRIAQHVRIFDSNNALIERRAVLRQRYAADTPQMHFVQRFPTKAVDLAPGNADLHTGLRMPRKVPLHPCRFIRHLLRLDASSLADDAVQRLRSGIIMRLMRRHRCTAVLRGRCRVHGQIQARTHIGIIKRNLAALHIARQAELRKNRIIACDKIQPPRETAEIKREIIIFLRFGKVGQALHQVGVFDVRAVCVSILAGAKRPVWRTANIRRLARHKLRQNLRNRSSRRHFSGQQSVREHVQRVI